MLSPGGGYAGDLFAATVSGDVTVSGIEATGSVVYYRDPDGKPDYASEPKQTADGRDYRAVHASEDVRFDEPEEAEAMPDAGHGDMAMAQAKTPASARKVRFYRNPMGLPDTSPIPKKDSMGMDYLPVYEGEDTDDGTVKISPGKLQRTGVRTAVVERRVLSMPVRAPGAIEEDERRISVIAMRTDAFIEKVEAVTTGDHVHKGQPLLRLFSPEMNAAAAQYLTGIGYEEERMHAALRAGANGYVSKHLPMEQLYCVLSRMLATSRQRPHREARMPARSPLLGAA